LAPRIKLFVPPRESMEKTPGPWFANGSTSGAIVAPCPAFRHQSSTRGARCIGLRPRFGDVLAAGTESRRSWLAGESSSNGGPRASARQLGTCEFLLRVTLRTKETFGLRGWQWRQWGKRPTGASFLGALSSTWRSPAAGLPILLLSIPYSSGLTLPHAVTERLKLSAACVSITRKWRLDRRKHPRTITISSITHGGPATTTTTAPATCASAMLCRGRGYDRVER
jgi:hypothetical protein